MVKKYPQTAKYIWQTKGMPIENVYYRKPFQPKTMEESAGSGYPYYE